MPPNCSTGLATGKRVPASNVDLIKKQALDPFGTSIAVLNCLYGVQLLMSEDMASSFASAVNDWIKAEFLDKEPRLRASIVIPTQSPEMAVNEIERLANDKRFVSVLMLVMDENPLEGGSIGQYTQQQSDMVYQFVYTLEVLTNTL